MKGRFVRRGRIRTINQMLQGEGIWATHFSFYCLRSSEPLINWIVFLPYEWVFVFSYFFRETPSRVLTFASTLNMATHIIHASCGPLLKLDINEFLVPLTLIIYNEMNKGTSLTKQYIIWCGQPPTYYWNFDPFSIISVTFIEEVDLAS